MKNIIYIKNILSLSLFLNYHDVFLEFFHFSFSCNVFLLPLHTLRTVACIVLLLFLLLELSESLLTIGPLSQVISLMAIISCWILHRETEIRDGLGLATTAGAFTAVAVARVWRFIHLRR